MGGYHDCGLCNGTGIDEADFIGRCFRCRGSGQIEDREELDDDGSEPESERA